MLLTLASDENWIVAGGEGGLYLWNLKTGSLDARYEEDRIIDLALTGDEHSVIALVRSNELLIWSAQ